jgi:hypothetical protein
MTIYLEEEKKGLAWSQENGAAAREAHTCVRHLDSAESLALAQACSERGHPC